jgi:hypothetical protein
MKRPLIAFVIVLATATAAQAQTRSNGVPRPPEPLQQAQQAAGPRSDWTPTVAMSVARIQIEKSGYNGVRGLHRASDGTWHANALDSRSAPVSVVLDNQGHVTPAR